jgi:Adenine-specific DNA methylase containing a Zn-ribbon
MTKMIYEGIPIEFISQISKKEANSRKPIYQIHKWFGRKTDAIFRSILLALELEREESANFKEIYYKENHNLLEGKIILDPFMGGGVTLINTLRLGGKAIGIDVNPVAWFITKNELQVPEVNRDKNADVEEEIVNILTNEFEKLERNIGEEIKEAYTTNIYDYNENIKRKVDIMYILWVKKVRCPKCGKYVKLFSSYEITKLKKERFENYNICPSCGDIVKGNNSSLFCNKCQSNFDRDKGIYKGRNVICNNCNEKINLIKHIMKNRKKPLSADMYAIQYYDRKTGKKGFKVPDKDDLDNYNNVKKKIKNLSEKMDKFIPQIKIPQGYNTRQIQNHNYKYWKQMFNNRQLYYLSRLLEEIGKISDEEIKELFLCVFSNTVNANNMFCIYNSQCGKIEPLFGDHHMAPVINPVENNIWGTKWGRGSFTKYFRGFIQSKRFNISPYERLILNGKNKNVILKEEKFCSEFAENFEELISSSKNTILKCDTAEKLSFLPSKSVDAVITDPPYYYAINYGEISEFFYVWSRQILKDKYPCFENEHILCNDEVTVNEVKGISKEEFVNKLSRCFKEVRRVLKEASPLILTYNNSSAEGWFVLIQSLINAGFYVEKTYPIHTELRAGLIDNRREKMNYDLVIVTKVKNTFINDEIGLDEFFRKVDFEFKKTYYELNDKDLSNLDMLLIKVGKVFEIYSQYYNDLHKSSKKMGLKEILECIYNKGSNCNMNNITL